MQHYGATVLRLAVGAVFVAHGAQKLFGIWGGSGLAATTASFSAVGLNPAYPLAVLVGVVELAGGLLLIVGALTLVTALALILITALAIWKGQPPNIEHNLVLVASLAALMLGGAGAWSVDARRARNAEAEAAGRARLRAGKV
jgi:putative oxidoreductase